MSQTSKYERVLRDPQPLLKDMAPSCHPNRKPSSRGMCNPCYLRWLRDTPKEQRPPAITGKKPPAAPAKCHPDRPARVRGLCQQCYLSAYRKDHRDALIAIGRNNYFKRKFGITTVERDELIAAQDGKCQICEKQLAKRGRTTHIDHCHKTGVIRGVLCNGCNLLLGRVEKLLPKMLQYIQPTQQRN